MARRNNLILGRGEELTHHVTVPSGGGDKNPPYTFATARRRLAPRIQAASAAFATLPVAARPKDQVVAVVTMHPRYISKSDFPERFFSAFGLSAIGSRTRRIAPEQWGIKEPPRDALTNEIFVAGSIGAFGILSAALPEIPESQRWASDFTHIEDVTAFAARAKLHIDEAPTTRALYEVVIHTGHGADSVRDFMSYARSLRAEPLEEWRRNAGGLSFLPVLAVRSVMPSLAAFAFVRVARVMPRLRAFQPDILRLPTATSVKIPDEPALDPDSRVVLFDGGLPDSVDLSRWVTCIEGLGVGSPTSGLQEHGLAVTSAVLFGSIQSGQPSRPLCHIDHVRVMDSDTGSGDDLDYFRVLDRIVGHLNDSAYRYHFAGICLGPRHAITDDEVTQWTARLDECLAAGSTLTVVAAGNDGELDPDAGLNRIQPPADGVNVLSVGACDREGEGWRRASYSCVGPGRAPGIVKPDGVAFGGSTDHPYIVLGSQPVPYSTLGVGGTSVAAPHALRSAIAVRTQLGSELSPLAIRALLIHCAEGSDDVSRAEIGWGRFRADYTALVTCEDHEVLVVYQGVLPIDYHLRAPIPLPRTPLSGKIEITATLLLPTEVDPEHAGAYTRSGVCVAFRPDSRRYRQYGDGTVSQHPVTEAFFSVKNMCGAAEYDLLERGQKWEPCISARKTKQAAKLHEPCFDIDYQRREGPANAVEAQSVRYALIVSVRAPRVGDFYNQVVRDYAGVLVPIRPRIRIQV